MKLLSLVVSLLWHREGYWIRDVLHGFKGFTLAAFRQMSPSDEGLSIDLELTVRSYRLRLKRAEFPTQERPRTYSATRFKILPTGMHLLRYLWRELRAGAPGAAGGHRHSIPFGIGDHASRQYCYTLL